MAVVLVASLRSSAMLTQGNLDAALAFLEEAYDAMRSVLGAEHPDTLFCGMCLGTALGAKRQHVGGPFFASSLPSPPLAPLRECAVHACAHAWVCLRA